MALEILNKTIGVEKVKEVKYTSAKQKITLLSLGAAIKRWETKDKNGRFENIVITYARDEDYLQNTKFLGATVGPYAGRIYPSELVFGDTTYPLSKNFMDHANLHSGPDNITTHNFHVEQVDPDTVVFETLKPEKDHEFPGNMTFRIIVTFTEDTMRVTYETTSDALGVANVTNHSYFNLSGELKSDIREHTLKLPSNEHVELDGFYIGTLVVKSANTPFDFSNPKPLKEGIMPLQDTPQKGIDHPFILHEGTIVLQDPKSGRNLHMETDYDAVVVYTNNILTDHTFETGKKDSDHLAVCLECQHVPNDINLMAEPKSIIKPGETKTRTTIYKVNQ